MTLSVILGGPVPKFCEGFRFLTKLGMTEEIGMTDKIRNGSYIFKDFLTTILLSFLRIVIPSLRGI
jgi:hypothetical protein